MKQKQSLTTNSTKIPIKILSIKDVSYTHNPTQLTNDINHTSNFRLQPISADFYKGEICFIKGQNGVGKSTFLDIIAGLLPAYRGELTLYPSRQSTALQNQVLPAVNSKNLTIKERAAKIASLAQKSPIIPEITVLKCIQQGLIPEYGLEYNVTLYHQRIYKIAATFELINFFEKNMGELSGGEQKRVHCTRLLLQNAPIYLLDEPFTALDNKYQQILAEQLQEKAQAGALILFSAHNHQLAEKLATRVLELSKHR